MVDAGLAVGRVEEHVRVRRLRQGTVAERRDLLVEVLADPRHLRLGDPGVRAESLHQVIDLPGAHAMQVCLHDHREQRLVDPAPALQQAREERSRPQLRDPQLQISGRRGQQSLSGPVSDRRAALGAFQEAGTDHALGLRIDQRLIHALRGHPHALIHAGGLQRLQQFQQGRLVHSHRAKSSRELIRAFSLTFARWPSTSWTTPRSSPKTHHPVGRHQKNQTGNYLEGQRRQALEEAGDTRPRMKSLDA